MRSRQERLERALEITRLLAAEVKLDVLLPLVATKTTEALAADRATIYLVDHERQELWTRAVSKLEIQEIRLPLGTGLAGHVANTGVTLLIPDCYQDARFDKTWDRKNRLPHAVHAAHAPWTTARVIGWEYSRSSTRSTARLSTTRT